MVSSHSLPPLSVMETIEELNQNNEFQGLCAICRLKCKDHMKICFSKKLLYAHTKKVYLKRVKKGLIKQ